jgi:Fe-S oxidoreductase
MDQLLDYQFDKIFPGCRLLDIHEYLMEKGLELDGVSGTRYLYHDPCHTPMKTYAPQAVVNKLMGTDVALSARCCGESGTFAVARPDIATQVRFRKEEEIRAATDIIRAETSNPQQAIKILTSCPSCLQGLSRYDDDNSTQADYIVIEMAKSLLGERWMEDYVAQVNEGGIERVLL